MCDALRLIPLSEDDFQKPQALSLRSNEILTAVIHGARKEEPSVDVQLAAIHALYNSLEFVRDNFEREVSRIFGYPSNWDAIFWYGRANATTSCKSSAKRLRTPRSQYRSARSSAWSE